MANPMLKPAFSDLHDARFREIYDRGYKGYATYYDKVLKEVTSSRSYEQYSGISGHTMLQEKTEDANTQSETRIQDYDITLTNRTFTLDAQISYENVEDDLTNKLNQEASVLGKAAKRTPDIQAADMFKYGFSTTDSYGASQLAADGIRYFSTLHYKNPSETGTTYSNASASGIVLSDDNFETGRRAVAEQKDARGILGGFRANKLIVPLALEKVAKIITMSDKRSETADNDMNFYKGMGVDVIVWPELGAATSHGTGSDTAWFLMDSNYHEMLFQWREKPNVLPVEFNKKKLEYTWTAKARYEFGMVGWRGAWSSKGNGSAYSS